MAEDVHGDASAAGARAGYATDAPAPSASTPSATTSSGSVVTTERLTLRPFAPEDADELHALLTDADVRRYLLDDVVVARSWVDEEIAASEDRFAELGHGLWSLRRTGETHIVGFVGFRPFFDPPEIQLIYGLLPEAWGTGLATEAGAAVLDRAFGSGAFEEVIAATDAPNAASIAVLRRLGFREWKRTEDGEEGTVFFRLRAGEWREDRNPANRRSVGEEQ